MRFAICCDPDLGNGAKPIGGGIPAGLTGRLESSRGREFCQRLTVARDVGASLMDAQQIGLKMAFVHARGGGDFDVCCASRSRGHGNGGVTGQGEAIIRWVEEGVAPDKLINRGQNGRTRPLFPYPEVAKYKGTGSTDEADNFVSTLPAH